MEIPREWFWDPTVEWAWPVFVKVREGLLAIGFIPDDVYWAFDELLRAGVLMYLAEGPNEINITMPTASRTSF